MVTAVVEMVNVAVCDFAGIRTVFPFGNVALGLLLVNETRAPPAGAGPPRETVPVTVVPPITAVAVVVSCASSGGVPLVFRET